MLHRRKIMKRVSALLLLTLALTTVAPRLAHAAAWEPGPRSGDARDEGQFGADESVISDLDDSLILGTDAAIPVDMRWVAALLGALVVLAAGIGAVIGLRDRWSP